MYLTSRMTGLYFYIVSFEELELDWYSVGDPQCKVLYSVCENNNWRDAEWSKGGVNDTFLVDADIINRPQTLTPNPKDPILQSKRLVWRNNGKTKNLVEVTWNDRNPSDEPFLF